VKTAAITNQIEADDDICRVDNELGATPPRWRIGKHPHAAIHCVTTIQGPANTAGSVVSWRSRIPSWIDIGKPMLFFAFAATDTILAQPLRKPVQIMKARIAITKRPRVVSTMASGSDDQYRDVFMAQGISENLA
jgi:hypothetical protein